MLPWQTAAYYQAGYKREYPYGYDYPGRTIYYDGRANDYHGKTCYNQNRTYNYQGKTTGITPYPPFINQMTPLESQSSSKTFLSKLDRSNSFSLLCSGL